MRVNRLRSLACFISGTLSSWDERQVYEWAALYHEMLSAIYLMRYGPMEKKSKMKATHMRYRAGPIDTIIPSGALPPATYRRR